MLLQSLFESIGGWTGLIIAAVLLFGLVFFLMLAKQYKRCPSNKVLVIYGKVKTGTSSISIRSRSRCPCVALSRSRTSA